MVTVVVDGAAYGVVAALPLAVQALHSSAVALQIPHDLLEVGPLHPLRREAACRHLGTKEKTIWDENEDN